MINFDSNGIVSDFSDVSDYYVNLLLKTITDRYAGMVYNAGLNCTGFRFSPGYDTTNGAVPKPKVIRTSEPAA